jgi:muramidase (phage lysozyme)
MREIGGVAAILAIAAGALYVSRAGASVDTQQGFFSDYFPQGSLDPVIEPITVTENPTMYQDFSLDQRIAAFLSLIRQFETGSTTDYNILYGGAHFSDYSKHPYDGLPLPAHSAAGAYQFIIKTWKSLQNKLRLPDFSPASQDSAAIELLRQIGAINALQNNNIDLALRKASNQWASLPYSTAGQNPKSLTAAIETYDNFLIG